MHVMVGQARAMDIQKYRDWSILVHFLHYINVHTLGGGANEGQGLFQGVMRFQNSTHHIHFILDTPYCRYYPCTCTGHKMCHISGNFKCQH